MSNPTKAKSTPPTPTECRGGVSPPQPPVGSNLETIIRPFDGSETDAQGILAVERATFRESPYSAGEIQAMLTPIADADLSRLGRPGRIGPQHAWLALTRDVGARFPRPSGFVVAFPTEGLSGRRWEIDLLAVLPRWRDRGLASGLIQAATEFGARFAAQARAVVATDNSASLRAFSRAGFQAHAETCQLLIYRTEDLAPRPKSASGVSIHQTRHPDEAAAWLPQQPAIGERPGLSLLLAEQSGRPAGYAELIEVETLLYRGFWIEALTSSSRAAREALIHEVVNQAHASGLDEVGAMVSERNWPLRDSLLAAGFRSLGDFRWLIADLAPTRHLDAPAVGAWFPRPRDQVKETDLNAGEDGRGAVPPPTESSHSRGEVPPPTSVDRHG